MISVPITLDQLISAVQKLRPEERSQVAKALIESELQSELAIIIEDLYSQPPVNDISDADINSEIKAVRQQHR